MYGPFGAVERAEVFACGFQNHNQYSNRSDSLLHHEFANSPTSSEVSLASPVTALMGALAWVNDLVEAQLRSWRWGRPVRSFSLLAFVVIQSFLPSDAFAEESSVRFDVPALVEATVAADTVSRNQDGLMTIEVAVPVTSEIAAADRDHIDEFRYDIQWQQARYPVIDYGPRTQTTSHIEGTIGFETQKDRNATFGLALNGGELHVLGGSAKAEAAMRDAEKIRYQEIPQHDVLVASGSIDRGTGVFFRFHRSRRETLEGSRELSIAFRVPQDWQAGLLKVKCRASGERKVAGLWSEPIEIVRSFSLPVYLTSSSTARDRAVEYVRAENGLQEVSMAATKPEANSAKPPSSFEQTLRGIFGAPIVKTQSEPQSRVVRYRVPYSASEATGRYRNAREELLQLSH